MSELTRKESSAKPKEVQVKRFPSTLDDFEGFLDNVFPRFWPTQWDRLWERHRPFSTMKIPRVDVMDGKDEIKIYAEIPGVKKADLDVSMTDHNVTIKGHTHRKDETREADFYRCEIEQGEFSRTIALPAEVNGSKVKAKFEDGVLVLTIPKMEQAKRHSIKIE